MELIKHLVESGVDINAHEEMKGFTGLHISSAYGN